MGTLRFLLALSVIVNHSGALLFFDIIGGKTAVQTFYIISGFYMSLILNEKYVGINNSYKLFITNRFIRLFPTYWVILLCTIISAIGVMFITNFESIPKFDKYIENNMSILSLAYMIFTNIFIFGQDIVMFLGLNTETGSLFFTEKFAMTNPPLHTFLMIPQAWTVGLELTFYLIAPFMLKKGIKNVLILITLVFTLRMFLYNYFDFSFDPWTFRFLPTELIFFLFGYLSYYFYTKIRTKEFSKSSKLIVYIAMIIFTLFYNAIPEINIPYFPFKLKESLYFAFIVSSIPILFIFLKKTKWDIVVGELSYPIYLSHMLIIMVCHGLPFSFLQSSIMITIITVIFSFGINYFIENPIDKYRQKRIKQ
ncbi:MAG: acyltransferase [Bacteroidales bacterium]|nr:acyltransferase [Bacteroidales bacterium]